MRTILLKATVAVVGTMCLWAITAGAQDIQGTPGGEFVEAVDLALQRQPLSLNPAEYLADSFFDVFVEIVLEEGITDDMEIPGIVNPGKMLAPMTSDEVTQRIRQDMPQLFEALPELNVTVDGTTQPVPVAPGAAVYKWGHAGRWSRGPHVFNIQTTAKVYQWIRASIYATNIVWTVFKPGAYSTDCIYLNLHSNAGLSVALTNNGPLVGTTPSGVNVVIPTAYALSDYVTTAMNEVFLGQTTQGATIQVGWVPDGASGTGVLPAHKMLKLWNFVRVGSDVPPGTYATSGPSAVLTVMADPSTAGIN